MLGFKAPLAYSSSFYFVARKDGMERKYMMYEGEDVNTIDLLYETPTDQPNGVRVVVPLKYGDRYDFQKKIAEQLAYFDSVYFDVDVINNDFTIVRHEYFQFSELANDGYLHICLDNVYYPMDFGKLGIDRIKLPVGLRFSLTDGIFPTPNRESIRYTTEAKAVILKRLSEAANYFIEKYNETITDTDDVKQIVDYFSNSRKNLKFGKNSWDVNPLAEFATVKIAEPKFKGTTLLSPKQIYSISDYILSEYQCKFVVTTKAVRDGKNYYCPTQITRLAETIYVYHSDKVSGVKKDYLRSLRVNMGHGKDISIFKKTKSFTLFPRKGHFQEYDNYYNILRLKDRPKHQWRQLIQEFQLVIKSLTSKFINLDDLEIPQSFIDSRKKQRVNTSGGTSTPGVRRIKLKGEMVCKQAEPLERWVDGKNCKWVSKIYDMSKFHQNKFILVYGKQEDAEKMDEWFKPAKNHKIEFAILSERELKLVSGIELHNLMPFSKFMEGKNKPFQRIATACLIDQFADKFPDSFSKSRRLESISSNLYAKFNTLNEYVIKNRKTMDDSVRDAIVEHAQQVNGFDPEIYSVFKEVKAILEKFTFIEPIMDSLHNYEAESDKLLLKAMVDLFKYHKHRIDWKNYNITLNEDLPLEQTLTTETVEELMEQD